MLTLNAKRGITFFAILMLMSFVISSCSKTNNTIQPAPNAPEMDEPEEQPVLTVKYNGADIPSSISIPSEGGEWTLSVTASEDWEYSLSNNPDWISESGKSSESLALNIQENESETSRSSLLIFTLKDHPDMTVQMDLRQIGAELKGYATLLDVQFNEDGTATDISRIGYEIETVNDGRPASVAYNDTYGLNVVHFDHGAGGPAVPSEAEGGFYKINYNATGDMDQGLSDGFSIELLMKSDRDFAAATPYQILTFSSQGDGGTGLMMSSKSWGLGSETGMNTIGFAVSVSDEEGGGTRQDVFANSMVVPNNTDWYHVIGVWDKEKGKAIIYINGEEKASVDAAGFYYPPIIPLRWFAVGGNPNLADGGIAGSFGGSIAIARVYDDVLSADDVNDLWDKVK